MAGLMTNAATPAGAPATVDVNWTLFQTVYASVDLPLTNAVNGVLGALAGYLKPDNDRNADGIHDVHRIQDGFGAQRCADADDDDGRRSWRDRRHPGRQCRQLQSMDRDAVPHHNSQRNRPSNQRFTWCGGLPINGGQQFDAVWNASYKAGLIVYDNLPSVSMKGVASKLVRVPLLGRSASCGCCGLPNVPRF